jgi:hypothetical protein
MRTTLAVATILVAASGWFGVAQESPTSSVFTAAQAAAGRIAYHSVCFNCHQDSLAGRKGELDELPPLAALPPDMQTTIRNAGGNVPPLAGPAFMARWAGRTTADLSQRIRVASPFLKTVQPPLPEDLDENAYLNLTAYILQVNGGQPGLEPLTATTAVPIRRVTSSLTSTSPSASAMRGSIAVTQQNELTQMYCTACHDDARRVGGLTLEHFDEAPANPTVAAMMLSKLTNGLSLDVVKTANTNADAGALVEQELKTSAEDARRVFAACFAIRPIARL